MPETIDLLKKYALQYGLNILAALLIFIVGKWIARISSRLAEQAMVKSKVNRTIASFAKTLVYFGLMTIVSIAALNKLGVETNSFIAVIGAASLAVGLALQGALANFAAGVMLILFQPFQAGDRIEAGGADGTVEEIQIFNTVFTASEGKKVIVPNSKITGDKIVVHPRG